MAVDPEFLFVYGTLRPSAGGEGSDLVRHLRPAGRASVRGMLYDLGTYPGMVEGHGVVHGELLHGLSGADLEALDRYEESDGPSPLFRRVPIEARREDGDTVGAWIYMYARSVSSGTRIEGGDYLHRNRAL